MSRGGMMRTELVANRRRPRRLAGSAAARQTPRTRAGSLPQAVGRCGGANEEGPGNEKVTVPKKTLAWHVKESVP
jgi:hypothetical protein